MESKERIKELTKLLNEANYLYYVQDAPTMPDFEYDHFLRELEDLEKEHPEFAMPDSPTKRVGGQALSKFEKVSHPVPLTSSKLEVVSRDIIDSKNWDRVNHLFFLSLAQFHEKRVEALKKENAEYTIYDLKLFSNKEGEIWGSNKEGKAFAFNYFGRFVPVESLIDFNVSKDKEVSKIEAMLKQAEIRTDGEINDYLSICEEQFPNDYPEIGENLGFFFKENKESGFNVYVTDNNNNEFLCKIDRLILQKKGTIAHENANPLPITDVIHTIIMDDIINKEKNDKE